jgi:hypothetical protein
MREPKDALLKMLRQMMIEALEERKGLVVYARMEAQEMDRLARKIERDALEKIRAQLPEYGIDAAEISGIRTRLGRMDELVGELDAREDIPETSRQLERDDIIWRTFEDMIWILGIE